MPHEVFRHGLYTKPHVSARRGIHTASPTRHTGSTQPAPQDIQGPHNQPHKTHGVHTASPTRHTGTAFTPKHSSHAGKTHFFRKVQVLLFSKSTFYVHWNSFFVVYYFFAFFMRNTAAMQVKLTFSEKYRFFDFQNRRFTSWCES